MTIPFKHHEKSPFSPWFSYDLPPRDGHLLWKLDGRGPGDPKKMMTRHLGLRKIQKVCSNHMNSDTNTYWPIDSCYTIINGTIIWYNMDSYTTIWVDLITTSRVSRTGNDWLTLGKWSPFMAQQFRLVTVNYASLPRYGSFQKWWCPKIDA